MIRYNQLRVSLVVVAMLAPPLSASEPKPYPGVTPDDRAAIEGVMPANRPYSPYAGRVFPNRPYFGDTHLHTSLSLDAGTFGARLGPREAYRFARGEEITSSTGQRVRLSRPLDFLVVADHSDNMGFFTALFAGDPQMLADPTGRRWYEMVQSGKGAEAAFEIIASFSQGTFPENLEFKPGTKGFRATWEEIIDAAEEANDPGRFTAFIGYEWTSQGAFNIHRNVVYRDGREKAGLLEPFTTSPPLGSPHETDLWKWMQAYEEKTGGDVLAIPHNGNVSNGLMFGLVEAFTDKPIGAEYVANRAKWEPLYEVTQMKGDSETHPFLSPNDEFADYETWDKGNLNVSEAKKNEMLQYEYARSALKLGLKLETDLGVNPFKFGMIGSTDSHTGLATAEEDNFFGKVPPMEPNPDRLQKPFIRDKNTGLSVMEWEVVASGYAAVWATDNSRKAIFDAMERRETYGTTGPRMVVRFFGGWEFQQQDARTRLPAHVGYQKGVPMGGDLSQAPEGGSPTFLVAALKDPIGANLDRIQIVKGWLTDDGSLEEKVYDVVWADSDTRKPGKDGKLPAVGNTVDIAAATWTNTIGDPELITVWKDPDFDAAEKAFYYVRVLEIPTPRWTAYDARYYGVNAPDEVPMITQERAYTSPIWYTPVSSQSDRGQGG